MRGSPWGREIIYAAKPLQIVLNAIYNLMIDSTTFGVIPACTVNKNKLDPDEDFDSLDARRGLPRDRRRGDPAAQDRDDAVRSDAHDPVVRGQDRRVDHDVRHARRRAAAQGP